LQAIFKKLIHNTINIKPFACKMLPAISFQPERRAHLLAPGQGLWYALKDAFGTPSAGVLRSLFFSEIASFVCQTAAEAVDCFLVSFFYIRFGTACVTFRFPRLSPEIAKIYFSRPSKPLTKSAWFIYFKRPADQRELL
jgi:hypothetical protein